MKIPDHLTCLLKNLYAGQEATDLVMEYLIGSKLGEDYIMAVYCHPPYLSYMQSTLCEMPDWKTHKFESRLLGELSATLDIPLRYIEWQRIPL